jgi:hypothetical protein
MAGSFSARLCRSPLDVALLRLRFGSVPDEKISTPYHRFLDFADYEREFSKYVVLYYEVEIAAGAPRALEHADMRLVKVAELSDYAFSSCDGEVAQRLMRGM